MSILNINIKTSNPVNIISDNNKQLLPYITIFLELASESRLSMLQFRGLFEHLNPNSSHHHRTSDSLTTSTTTTNKKKKKRIPLECLAALRKKEDIIKSGSYERDTFVPPKGKGRLN